jgi:arylsulfatase A-like enzyme
MSKFALLLSGLAVLPLLPARVAAQSNVLVLVADDVGVDMLARYELGSDLPATPAIDQLATNGVVFRNAWSNPVCSPTRATILTGRYSFRTGIGYVVDPTWALQPAELTLPEALDLLGAGYAHAAIGKWHLGNHTVGAGLAPNLAGFDHFAGTLVNVSQPSGYSAWNQTENGETAATSGYVTAREADDALDWIAVAPEPWLCYVAFQSAHAPFHAPPFQPYAIDLSTAGDPLTNPRPFYKAMVEAMDFEIGRIVQGLGSKLANTTILFVGDNGTPAAVTVPPFLPSHAKGTMYQGGIQVPLIVAGAGVSAKGKTCRALVNTTDLYATCLELAGVLPPPAPVSSAPPTPSGASALAQPGYALPVMPATDSVSLVPYLVNPERPSLRKVAFSESFKPIGPGPYTETHRSVRDLRYKLIVDWPAASAPESFAGGAGAVTEKLFDLKLDPFELDDLLQLPALNPDQTEAFTLLRRALKDLLAS